jgi:hypothetical protein
MGDYVIYTFGKVEWGDNSQTDILPWEHNVAFSHTYTTAVGYTIHAMFGAQFHFTNSTSAFE